MESEPPIEVGYWRLDCGRVGAVIRAGRRGKERIVPPAGEQYALDRELWARRIEINISPKGQSVRVWVDGEEV